MDMMIEWRVHTIIVRGLTFKESIDYIINRAVSWNMRIGEILYFIIGCFNKYLFWITSGIIYLVVNNLLVYIALGKKEFKERKNVNILLIITHLLNLIVSPVVAEVFFWMGGLYNHLLSLMFALILAAPLKNILEGEESLNKLNIKYILYLVCCFLVGFGSEAIAGTMVLALFITNCIIIVKNKKIDKFKLIPLFVLAISYIIFLILSKERIVFQGSSEWNQITKSNMKDFFIQNRDLQFIILGVVSIIYFIIIRLQDKKNLIKQLLILFCSILSMFVMLFATYYMNRAVIILDAGVIIWILYCLQTLINKINIKFVNIFLMTILVIFTMHFTYIQRHMYRDYNNYVKERRKEIIEQVANNEIVIFKIYNPQEINKYYNIYQRYIEIFEANQVYGLNINFEYNYYGDVIVDYSIMQ